MPPLSVCLRSLSLRRVHCTSLQSVKPPRSVGLRVSGAVAPSALESSSPVAVTSLVSRCIHNRQGSTIDNRSLARELVPMKDPFFFGYGSLVNQRTHDYPRAEIASLSGWERCWVGTSAREIAYLSIRPNPKKKLHGLIAAVPDADWRALDEREKGYRRTDVTDQIVGVGEDREVAVYAVHAPLVEDEQPRPILLSYLDVVIQGYFEQFGPGGPANFFDTTVGWNRPILDDRAAPQYPRHQNLDVQTRAIVDDYLDRSDLIRIRAK